MLPLPDQRPDLRRLQAFGVVILLALSMIIVRLWYLQIVKGKELLEMSLSVRQREVRRVAARGVILDSGGGLLATNRPNFVVSVLPDESKKHPEILPRLAQLLHTTEDELADLIKQNRKTPFDPVPLREDADLDLISKIEEQKLDLPGVFITKDPKRQYADERLCTHVLGLARRITAEKLDKLQDRGYRGGDYIGVEGIEASYETDLRGKDGGLVVEVDARGRMKRTVEERPPVPGHTLRLTINRELQRTAYQALNDQLALGRPGAAVAIDPNDGAVLAFVSMPSYDLNDYGKDFKSLLDNPDRPLYNRALYAGYPPGSPFKLITAAAGLKDGSTTANSGDYCPGFLMAGRRRFNCDVRSGHGSIGFTRAIAASCDVFFWHVAQRLGSEPDKLVAMAHEFGIGEDTGIDLPANREAKGRLPSPEWKKKTKRGGWFPGDTLNMAIGQGYVGVTPLQLADYTAAIANGGKLLKPQLVREIVDVSGPKPQTIHRLQPEVRRQISLSPEQLGAIVHGMKQVVERGGTAYGVFVYNVSIAAKTGSAEVIVKGKAETHSVFVCFAPVEKPKIAIAVLVEKGGHGSEIAAPIANKMLNQFFYPKGNAVAKAAPRQRTRRHRRG